MEIKESNTKKMKQFNCPTNCVSIFGHRQYARSLHEISKTNQGWEHHSLCCHVIWAWKKRHIWDLTADRWCILCHVNYMTLYRVTHQVVLKILLTSKQKLCFSMKSLYKKRSFNFDVNTTSRKPDMSPCIHQRSDIEFAPFSKPRLSSIITFLNGGTIRRWSWGGRAPSCGRSPTRRNLTS